MGLGPLWSLYLGPKRTACMLFVSVTGFLQIAKNPQQFQYIKLSPFLQCTCQPWGCYGFPFEQNHSQMGLDFGAYVLHQMPPYKLKLAPLIDFLALHCYPHGLHQNLESRNWKIIETFVSILMMGMPSDFQCKLRLEIGNFPKKNPRGARRSKT